jgi:hypothetical protein
MGAEPYPSEQLEVERRLEDIMSAARRQAIDELESYHLGEREVEIGVELLLKKCAVGGEDLPCMSVPARVPPRSHALDHGAEDLVSECLEAVRWRQAHGSARGDITPDGLAIDLANPRELPHAVAGQPQPQHLSNRDHRHLPERHAPPPAGGLWRRVSRRYGRPADFRGGP